MHRSFTRRTVLTAALAAVAVSAAAPRRTRGQEAPATPATAPTLEPLPDAPARAGGPLVVVATTPILADIARQVGGARVEVTSILPVNADAHDFEPAPTDVVAVEGADLVIEHGLHLDEWASDLVANAGGDAARLVATDGVTALPTDDEEFDEGDPHVWFDPRNVAVMATTVSGALAEIDPEGAAAFAARSDAYGRQLAALDSWIAEQIATIPPERRKLVTNHDAFRYYVERYSLTFVGSVIPGIDSRAEPSAKETAELIEKIREAGVPAIFTEASIDPQLEEELASQAGVAVVPNLYSDNLGESGSGADTYIGMMVVNTNTIVGALR